MIEAMFQGLLNVFTPSVFAVVVAGSLFGVMIGILPAIGGLQAMAVALPFLFGSSAFMALPFLAAMMSTNTTGGSMTSILLNIPGDAPNAATCLDGFPLTKRGEGGRAIGAALTSATAGGAVGILLALIMIPVIVILIMTLHMPDLVFLIVLGISFMGALASDAPIKGVISGVLGLLIATIGLTTNTGEARFTWGSNYLITGINLIFVALGMFAISSTLELGVRGKVLEVAPGETAITAKNVLRGMWQGTKDVLHYRWLWLRSCVIGYIIGVIPGVSRNAASFICYGQAKKTSRHPEAFGTGTVEGVIAPESANNACVGGDILTTLAFGIPGSSSCAFLLGAFLMTGIQPGPGLLTEHQDLSFTILWTVFVASIIGGIICLLIAPSLTKLITSIHSRYLFPIIMVLIFVGGYTVGEDMLNLIVIVVFGVLGFIMSRYGFSLPTFLLGFIMGNLFENYLWLSIDLQGGPLFFLRAPSLIIIAFILGIYLFNPIKSGLTQLFRGRKYA